MTQISRTRTPFKSPANQKSEPIKPHKAQVERKVIRANKINLLCFNIHNLSKLKINQMIYKGKDVQSRRMFREN